MSGYGANQGPQTAPLTPGGPAAGGLDNRVLIAGIAASALAFLGSFLAWVSVDVEGDTETIRATEGDGMFTAITSAIAIGLFVAGLLRNNSKLAAISLLPSLITLVFGVLNFLDPERLARADIEGEAEGASSEEIDAVLEMFDFSSAFGLWIVLLGALVALAAGAMAALASRSNAAQA